MRRTFLSALMLLPGTLSQAARGRTSGGAPATLDIVISSIAFAEVKQPLTVGDTVRWINKDVVAHTATAQSNDWRVVIAANESATLVLKTAGTVDYFCEYHPNMTGRLVVRRRK